MDRQVVNSKLESLRRCLARIRSTCPDSVDVLTENVDAQDILTVNLTRAVQLAVDIGAHLLARSDARAPDSMGDTFSLMAEARIIDAALALRLRKAVGFRNIAIHSYEEIDWAVVHSICRERLVDFEDFARAVIDQD